MYIFNCSHEMALAAGRSNFTAPRPIRQMEHDLADFPLVWTTQDETGAWGWNLAVRELMLRRGIHATQLPSIEDLQCWRSLSHRSFAADYLRQFFISFPHPEQCVGHQMQFVTAFQDISFSTEERIIVKQPFSSSGRGNHVGSLSIPSYCTKVKQLVSRYGGVLVDQFFDKQIDFALEYDIAKDGKVQFLGYSLFEASGSGKYAGNRVAPQDVLKREIEAAADGFDINMLAEHHLCCLQSLLAGRYYGPLGIDMMVVKDGDRTKVHPCVEINLRMNMGIVAIRLYDRLLLLSRLVSGGATYEEYRQNSSLRFLEFLSETDFNAFHFGDLNNFLRSSNRLPLSPRRDCGFHAFLQSGRLCIACS